MAADQNPAHLEAKLLYFFFLNSPGWSFVLLALWGRVVKGSRQRLAASRNRPFWLLGRVGGKGGDGELDRSLQRGKQVANTIPERGDTEGIRGSEMSEERKWTVG